MKLDLEVLQLDRSQIKKDNLYYLRIKNSKGDEITINIGEGTYNSIKGLEELPKESIGSITTAPKPGQVIQNGTKK